jgi:hypothetical protein
MATKGTGRPPVAPSKAYARNSSGNAQGRSLRAAINAKCRECIHDDNSPGTWREQVAQCSVARCPLWAVRPEPSGGPFADPPRDPARVTRSWLVRSVGWANLSHPLTVPRNLRGDS